MIHSFVDANSKVHSYWMSQGFQHLKLSLQGLVLLTWDNEGAEEEREGCDDNDVEHCDDDY